jgi:PKHD-type hydroxylase
MLLEIPALLTHEQCGNVDSLLRNAKFIDGKLSAGEAARQVKANEELSPDAAQLKRLNNIVMGALLAHTDFQNAALPHRVAAPFYARYTAGMRYGEHIDDPVMGPPGQRYRSDIAVTVFLNAPEEYEGGELAIRTRYGRHRVKRPAGDAVLYPADSLHQVEPVSEGVRLVAVTWVQSLVRDPARRELLYELNQARAALMQNQPDSETTRQVDHSYVNLVRMWSEV